MAPPPEAPPTPETPATVLGAVADELRREDQQLLFPLMARINEIAEALGRGLAVDPDYLDEGIRLWSRYVNEVHQQRLVRLYDVFRTTIQPAEAVSRTPRRLTPHLPGPEEGGGPRGDQPGQSPTRIRGTQTRMAERIGVLRGLVAAYRSHEYYSPQMLASLLRSGAFSDRAWAKYEEEFVMKYLSDHVAAEEDLRLRREVSLSDELRTQVEVEVQKFLARPIATKAAPP